MIKMALLTHEKAIQEYYNQVKDKYPDVDFIRFRIICRSPFEFIKSVIKSTRMAVIMVKHLGKFIPNPREIRNQIRGEKVFLEKGISTQEQHDFKINYLSNYLKDLSSNDTNTEIINDIEG